MKVFTLNRSPSTRELAETLNRELSDQYACKLFGPNCDKSIIVSKSPFVGVQISKQGNEITVQGVPPTGLTVLFSALDTLFTGGLLMGLPFKSEREKFENEISTFLWRRYVQV